MWGLERCQDKFVLACCEANIQAMLVWCSLAVNGKQAGKLDEREHKAKYNALAILR